MRTEEIKQRIDDLKRMLDLYKIIFNDPKSILYKDETIRIFMNSHITELYILKDKLLSH